MLDQLKTALVDSFVGAIAVGWLFAQGIVSFCGIFTVPLQFWFQMQNRQYMSGMTFSPSFPVDMAIPSLLTALLLLVVAFVLLRWLYYPAAIEPDCEESSEPEQGA
jgi:hypothetical protein